MLKMMDTELLQRLDSLQSQMTSLDAKVSAALETPQSRPPVHALPSESGVVNIATPQGFVRSASSGGGGGDGGGGGGRGRGGGDSGDLVTEIASSIPGL